MNKKLAIKGHSTRGKEVIKLLEMMGGINDRGYIGTNTWKDEYYTLDNGYIRVYDWSDDIKFTLEEFWEKYPYKVGDKVIDGYGNPVTIKSMKWSEDFETMVYDFEETEDVFCAEDLEAVNDTNEVFLKIEKNTNMNIEFDLIKYSYEVKDGKLVISEKKPKYPDNYEECCDVLSILSYYNLRYYTYEHGYNEYATSNYLLSLQDKLNTLGKLIICRNAYWKIAGEELELDKTWEPDWNGHEFKYGLKFMGHRIEKTSEMTVSHVLCFPTEEMRDAFYENFKDLIEQCKELL